MHSSRGLGGGGGEACTKFMTELVDSWAAAPSTELVDSWAAAPSTELMNSWVSAPSTESVDFWAAAPLTESMESWAAAPSTESVDFLYLELQRMSLYPFLDLLMVCYLAS